MNASQPTEDRKQPQQVLSLLCPTRGRPHLVQRLLESLLQTSAVPQRLELLLYVDADDTRLAEYRALVDAAQISAKKLGRFELLVGEPKSVSKSWNDLAAMARGDMLLITNDDQVYASAGWDVRLDQEAATFDDAFYCLWFNDGINGEKHCAFPIVSRRWVEALGYLTPGIFEFLANDTWLMDIGRRLNRLHYVGDVLVEHRHFTVGKAAADETYLRHRTGDARDRRKRDMDLYERTAEIRERDAQRLRMLSATTGKKATP